jgi:hypothetical protein
LRGLAHLGAGGGGVGQGGGVGSGEPFLEPDLLRGLVIATAAVDGGGELGEPSGPGDQA